MMEGEATENDVDRHGELSEHLGSHRRVDHHAMLPHTHTAIAMFAVPCGLVATNAGAAWLLPLRGARTARIAKEAV